MISNSGTTSLGLYDFKRQLDSFGGVDYFRPTLTDGYLPNARVMLANGEIVQNSTNDKLTNDPNVDITGWVKTNTTSHIFDPNGISQQVINDSTEILTNGNFSLVGNIEYPEFGSQSVGKVNNIPLKRYFDMRGYYAEKPAAFDWDVHGVRAWLDMQGIMQHNLKPEDYDVASKSVGVVEYFVKKGGTVGSSNLGTDPLTPLGAIYAAISRINTNVVPNAIIWITPEVYTDAFVWGANNAIKSNVSIKIWNGSTTAPFADTTDSRATITTETTGLAWSNVGLGTYSTSRTAVGAVVDETIINKLGDSTLYEKVSDLASCQSKAGTWAQDGSTLYVHAHDNRTPDNALHIYVNKVNAEVGTGNYTFYCERVNFYGGDKAFYGKSTALNTDEYIFFKECSFLYATNNGLETRGIRYPILLNSSGSYAGSDGFNYHTSIEQPTKLSYVLEVNCLTYQNGKYWSNLIGSNNGSTVHDGSYIVRFNTVTYQNEGPNFADVGGGKSWLFNCIARDSYNPVVAGTHADYYTQNNLMWIDHCDSSGSRYSLSADANGRIYVKNCNLYARIFQGNKIINWSTSVIT